jgi:CHAT domain-containing protein
MLMPADEALCMAQLKLTEAGVLHPYYWGAFQVTGASG